MNVKLYTKQNEKKETPAEEEIKSASLASANSAHIAPVSDTGKSLGDLFSEIDAKYSTGLIPDRALPGLERLELNEISPAEIEALAQTELKEYKETSESKINSAADTNILKQEEKARQTEVKAELSLKELDPKFVQAADAIKNNALKAGLIRSTIFDNAIKSNEAALVWAQDSVRVKLNEDLLVIRENINLLETQRKNALSAFDIAYAAKLEDKINKLSQDFEKKNQEIIKYNNTVARQEEALRQSYEEELIKRINEYAKVKGSGTGDYISELAREEKLNAAFNYLAALTKEEALRFAVGSDELKTQLGNKYNSLIAKLNLREK